MTRSTLPWASRPGRADRYLLEACTIALFTLFGLVAVPAAGAEGIEAEAMTTPAAVGGPFADPSASGGRGLGLWTNGAASGTIPLATGANELVVRVRGDGCGGSPELTATVDGRTVIARKAIAASTWTDVRVPVSVSAGSSTVGLSFGNDARTKKCDRNLRVDRVDLTAVAPPPAPTGNPFAGRTLWVDPHSSAKAQADGWRTSRPADAFLMDRIAAGSQADWFGDWNPDVRAAVDARVSTIAAAGALPVLVAYNIPLRDCGLYSGGGAASADAYRTWIRDFAAGIGSRPAAVVLEPDAAMLTDCLGTADTDTRFALLADAVDVLAARPGVAVYVDGGNSNWRLPEDAAARLRRAGVARARGFSLNVSNFNATPNEATFGLRVSGLVDAKPFVIDTSRNGLGTNGEWCNPDGRALGARPGSSPPDPRIDALLWIKRPGESDGTCNGGPAAGAWWADHALGLAARATP